MLLLVILALVDSGSSYGTQSKCYGDSYEVPLHYTPPLFPTSIYFKPRGEERTLAVNQEGKSKHKRFLVGVGSIQIKDLTEQDEGAMVSFGQRDSVTLEIRDCQEPQSSNYGDLFSWRLPSGAEYMEFSQMTSSGYVLKPEVIWNRTDTSFGRGKVKRSYYELYNLKQKDSGYYKFMGAKGELIKWKRLKVTEYNRNIEHKEGDDLEIRFPVKFSRLQHVLFTSQKLGDEEKIETEYLNYRMTLTDSYFSILDLKYADAGTYKFIDDDGFLALHMELEVEIAQLPTWVYILALIIIVLCIILCCCCVKKCCCKKSSNKRNSPETTAAPPVFYHDTTQPTQPVMPLLSREPRVISADPPEYNSVVGNMDLPPSAQVTVPGVTGPTSTSMISTSSDSEPTFTVKGMVFPSAPPLSSGTSIENVYTSNKLNFL